MVADGLRELSEFNFKFKSSFLNHFSISMDNVHNTHM